MIEDNVFWYFPNLFTEEECNKIIEAGENMAMETANTAGGRDTGSTHHTIPQNLKTNYQLAQEGLTDKSYIRDSKVAWLGEKWVFDRLWKHVGLANHMAQWNYHFDWSEQMQFTKYEAPGGFYGYHQDSMGDWRAAYKRYIPGVTPVPFKENGACPNGYVNKNQPDMIGKVRKLSLTVNLSKETDYEGGELTFDIGEHHESGEKILTNQAFKNQGTLVVFPSHIHHAVSPVTKGTRYSLVMWCLGRPFK